MPSGKTRKKKVETNIRQMEIDDISADIVYLHLADVCFDFFLSSLSRWHLSLRVRSKICSLYDRVHSAAVRASDRRQFEVRRQPQLGTTLAGYRFIVVEIPH